MIKLSDGGAYLINGIDIVEDSASAVNEVAAKTGCSVTKEEAAKNTIAYGILEGHNTSGNMEKLKIKFDKMTSHDITFVGISRQQELQALRNSQFLMYLLTAITVFVQLAELLMKMTICLVLHVQRNMAEYMYHLIRL